MESTGNLHPMSQEQNKGGFKLRFGQKQLVQFINSDPNKPVVNIQLPTGYGKTICAGLAYQQYREKMIVNRTLIVVPTIVQVEQYLQDFKEECASCGISINGVKRFDGDSTSLKYHKQNIAEVFVMTIGKLCSMVKGSSNNAVSDLLQNGRWLLIADEHHHYAPDMPWGDSIRSLNFQRTLAMSATPVRRDGSVSIFGDPDLIISLRDASHEEAIKRIRANIDHYFVWVMDSDGSYTKLTTDSLREELDLPSNLSAWETKRQLRYLNKYLSPLLAGAVACLNAKQIMHPNQHQMIIYAMSCRHAKSLSEAVNIIGLGGIKSDWVGVGPDGRGDYENKQIIESFKNRKIDCLVQVNKASEGFNSRSASVLVFLNLIGSTPQAEQQIGRGLRRNYAIKQYREDICDVFVPADSPLVQVVKDMESLIGTKNEDAHEDNGKGGVGTGGWLPSIPDWFIADAEHDRSEVFFVVQKDDPRVKKFAELASTDHATSCYGLDPHNDEHMERAAIVFSKLMQQQMTRKSIDDQLHIARQQCQKAANVAGAVYAKIKAGDNGSFDKTLIGDVSKIIHARWKRFNCGHTEMVMEDYLKKYQWLQSIVNKMKEGAIPTWLNI